MKIIHNQNRILHILKYLWQKTDEEHPVNIADLKGDRSSPAYGGGSDRAAHGVRYRYRLCAEYAESVFYRRPCFGAAGAEAACGRGGCRAVYPGETEQGDQSEADRPDRRASGERASSELLCRKKTGKLIDVNLPVFILAVFHSRIAAFCERTFLWLFYEAVRSFGALGSAFYFLRRMSGVP